MQTLAFSPSRVMNEFPPTAAGYRIVRPCRTIPKLSATTFERIKCKMGPDKAAHTSITIRKGPFRGMPLFFAALPERDTCDTNCPLWDGCYGKNSPFIKRFNPFAPGFEEALDADIELLAGKYLKGFVLRLWELGDFWDVESVDYWIDKLNTYPNLNIFGYSHRGGDIGERLDETFLMFPGRFNVMDSDGSMGSGVRPIAEALSKEDTETAIELGLNQFNGKTICPQQTGRTPSCITCGLCMHGTIPVAFLNH